MGSAVKNHSNANSVSSDSNQLRLFWWLVSVKASVGSAVAEKSFLYPYELQNSFVLSGICVLS